ncbi:MAG: YggT family protein [Proteobacteria bacterium]|nr:YggT family protein [Pseudomonadota bacterium]
MYAIGYPLNALVEIIDSVLFFYTIVIIAASVISWVNPDPYNPIVRTLRAMTDPLFAAIRRRLPRTGQFDFSPFFALLLILFVQRGILPIISRFISENMLQG